MLDKISFKDKVVIITGGSSGIGAETARMISEYGGKLTLVGRDEARLMAVAGECFEKSGHEPCCVQADLNIDGNCESVVNKTLETYGKIDILVNSAGSAKLGSIFDSTMAILDEMMSINFRVPYLMTQLCIPHLKNTKGCVVNVGASMLKRHRPGFLPYTISKSALAIFTMHTAPEIATVGVRINAISPGVTRTNILRDMDISQQIQPFVYDQLSKMFPNGTIIEPREVAILICLTASNLFPNLSGSNFHLDGAACMV